MPRVLLDRAHSDFRDAPGVDLGTRIKDVRDEPLTPGGRVQMRMFERVAGGRPHPRLRFTSVEVVDPDPRTGLFTVASAPTDADALREAIEATLRTHEPYLNLRGLDERGAPAQSIRFWRASIRVQRIARLFAEIGEALQGWIDAGALRGQVRQCRYVVRALEDETYATDLHYDDADTGTYHSYGEDKPFVHYLEQILASLPEEGSEAMAVLMGGTREAVRRQREQAQAHLDHLMRHKYSYELPDERDIERTLGGFLIDRQTRYIVSVVPGSDPLTPSYELLRVAPAADHPDAGAWIYRDADGGLRRQDHTTLQVRADDLRASPREPEELTFRRAPGDANLRPDVAFDWDGSGWIDPEPIGWVSWAGHCDVKAVLEQLGVTLTERPAPSITEWRSDTQAETEYGRDLLLEMIASVLELGSSYRLLDGTGYFNRGAHHFGGSRNDSLPDRLQFQGPAAGRSFRWPLSGRANAFVVERIEWADGTLARMGTAFFRYLPQLSEVTFEDNPHFLKTVEGDYNLIDVSGARLSIRVQLEEYDADSGFPTKRAQTIDLDLRPDAPRPEGGRYFLGTHIDDASRRRLYRAYYEPAENRIVAELEVWEKVGDRFAPRVLQTERIVMPMVAPLTVTLSREMKRDDPSQFSELLTMALREAKNICADTDKESEVWNGVVTRLHARKVAENREERIERWQVNLTARFGEAELDYLVQRNEEGEPKIFVPAVDDSSSKQWPDFLWREEPDVGSKGVEDGDWIVNDTMLERGLVSVRADPSIPSGFYVYDEHIKHVFELIYAGLAGYRYTIVHDNRRYGFRDEAAWKKARAGLDRLRAELSVVED